MNIIQNIYEQKCNTPSDINENLVVLKEYADRCESVVEMGVRKIVSTWAFLASNAHSITSIDIMHPDKQGGNLEFVLSNLKNTNKHFEFIEADTLNITIDEVDMIFIDTLHTYKQLSQELFLHGNKAKKYLAFHDTASDAFGLYDIHSDEEGLGLNRAIYEFIDVNSHWEIDRVLVNNNGMTFLKRNYEI